VLNLQPIEIYQNAARLRHYACRFQPSRFAEASQFAKIASLVKMKSDEVGYSLYLVTDSTEAILGSRDLVDVVEQALLGG
jgi:hypothetical protein